MKWGRTEKIYSLHFFNYFPSPLPLTHLLFYLSFKAKKKNILKEVENQNKIFDTLPLSLPLPPT